MSGEVNMNNHDLCEIMQAGDVLSVRTTGLMGFLIRMHETLHNPGRCYSSHNAPVVEDDDGVKHVVQVEPPFCRVVRLPEYFDEMKKKGHLWHCVRPAWLDEEGHAAGIIKAWQHKFSQYALSLDGKPYPKRDLFRLVIFDLTGGLINIGNRKPDYCTESCVNAWTAAANIHHVPDSVDAILFPGPYDIEQLLRDKDVLPICGNSPWLLRSIMFQKRRR